MTKPLLPADAPVCATVYSVVWPSTEALVRALHQEELEQMLARHRRAFTKHQDSLHDSFFDAWLAFAATAVHLPSTPWERYPTAGSSEAIREIIRQAAWQQQDLVVFDGEYEGYEAMAAMQGTRVHVVDRACWREQLETWRQAGPPWAGRSAQWWISQPSAIDGNTWPEFQEWLEAMDRWRESCQVWVDLTYLGRARQACMIDLAGSLALAGVVFSLSKVMGAYYRRIGGCMSRAPLPGLWGNRWFKNLDSLFLGQRWLEQAGAARREGQRHAQIQRQAMDHALAGMGGVDAWAQAGIAWQASDVPLLMHAQGPREVPEGLRPYWEASARGQNGQASHRLCLTPSIEMILEGAK